jgi:hypothetical protein
MVSMVKNSKVERLPSMRHVPAPKVRPAEEITAAAEVEKVDKSAAGVAKGVEEVDKAVVAVVTTNLS